MPSCDSMYIIGSTCTIEFILKMDIHMYNNGTFGIYKINHTCYDLGTERVNKQTCNWLQVLFFIFY